MHAISDYVQNEKERSEVTTQTLPPRCRKADPQTNTHTNKQTYRQGDYNRLHSLARSVIMRAHISHNSGIPTLEHHKRF